jgi:hypothetical protein
MDDNYDAVDFFKHPYHPKYFGNDEVGSWTVEEPVVSTPITQSDPKLDLNQIASSVGLSPNEIEDIITGKPHA